MRANAKQVTPLEPNHGMRGSYSDAAGYLCCRDMLVRGTEAQGGIGIVRVAEAHLHESSSWRFAWAEGVVRKRLMVQYSIHLPILLVAKGCCDCVCLE